MGRVFWSDMHLSVGIGASIALLLAERGAKGVCLLLVHGI